ncbi:tetratricopeptide repeat [Paramuricea clavata]|uniref:Tetratricopeptide repeat n=1 Tax=Paramuricea clavata TaxID=317549 RepID=A0A7D9HX42_PARCT|nr:tetratricopeptide repeat [Paramuricea clavata]
MIGTVYHGVAQNMSKAQEFHELALDLSRRYNSTNEIALSLHLLGIIHRYQRNMDTARRYHEDAVELGRKIFSPKNNGRLAAFLLNLAVVYNRLGQLAVEEARLVYQETLKLTRKQYGSRDGRVLNTLSTNYYALGKYDESIEALLEALSIHEETHGDYHPNVAETLYFLGFTYRVKGELQNSIQMLTKSLKIRQQYYGDQHYQVAEVLHDISNTQRELSLLDDALQNAERCVEILRDKLTENSAGVAVSLNGLGHIYLALGDPNVDR